MPRAKTIASYGLGGFEASFLNTLSNAMEIEMENRRALKNYLVKAQIDALLKKKGDADMVDVPKDIDDFVFNNTGIRMGPKVSKGTLTLIGTIIGHALGMKKFEAQKEFREAMAEKDLGKFERGAELKLLGIASQKDISKDTSEIMRDYRKLKSMLELEKSKSTPKRTEVLKTEDFIE